MNNTPWKGNIVKTAILDRTLSDKELIDPDIQEKLVKESKSKHGPATPEVPPVPNSLPAIWDLVIEDMKARDKMGFEKYGTHLQAFNGRDGLWDAYQEALDLIVYLRQTIFERDNKIHCFADGKEVGQLPLDFKEKDE